MHKSKLSLNSREPRKLLVFIGAIGQKFLAFFLEFGEDDACALLSAYGLHALEVDRLQNNCVSKQKETSANSPGLPQGKWKGQPFGPIPLGIHPDCTRANWAIASQNTFIGRKNPNWTNGASHDRQNDV
jgi:hypothetical protein